MDELAGYPEHLFHYLDELSAVDPHLTSDFADHQVSNRFYGLEKPLIILDLRLSFTLASLQID